MSNMIIDTTSYTNKDFRSIWPELLELVNDLTDSWDPNNSNEADPGVALLKLKAFIADKLNYNIDKNTLEAFPSSVTQRGNAQKLYDLAGYELKWYKSATTELHFKFINPAQDSGINENTGVVTFTIPRFAQVKNADGTTIYTVLESTIIDTENQTQTEFGIPAIEGPVETFLINGVDTITINNLDADYRLYFQESMIASNGIYINNIGSDEFWQNTFNLESTQLGQKVFKFGILPNTNQCYLEFPQDSAELFGQGINIHYVISSGTSGNVKANVLQEFAQEYPSGGIDYSENSYSLNKYIKVTNPAGTNNGEDPESLESAYKNYQKTVNTFSTLVTLMDYYNAIYNEGNISNGVVTDRTTDFNSAYLIKSKTLMGETDITADASDSSMKMNAFNLALYALNSVPEVFDKNTYDKTFTTSYNAQRDGIASIEDYKFVQHEWKDLFQENLLAYLFKNMIKINGQIITYEKKSTVEANQIINKIKVALYKEYQSRNIDFGKDLNYDDLIKIILNADSRIKNVILDDPEYETKAMFKSNDSYSLNIAEGSDISKSLIPELKKKIVTRSILAGVTPLFIFDKDIEYSYTMGSVGSYTFDSTKGHDDKALISYNSETEEFTLAANAAPDNTKPVNSKYENISLITTQVDVPLTSTGYEIKENETVHFYAPNFISTAQLSTYLYVCIQDTKSNSEFTIPANSIYKLTSTQTLYVSETLLQSVGEDGKTGVIEGTSYSSDDYKYIPTNADGIKEIKDQGKAFRIYGPGTIIKPSFTMEKIDSKGGIQVGSSEHLKNYVNLESSKTIDIIEENKTLINKKNISDKNDLGTKTVYCTWITDDINNSLFNTLDFAAANGKNRVEHILQQNEVFIYTDSTKSDLIILQSGTKVSIPYFSANRDSVEKKWTISKPSMSDINNYGINALTNFWVEIPRSMTFFEVQELQIHTLGQGVTIFNNDASNPPNLKNPFSLKNKALAIQDSSAISWETEDGQIHTLPPIDIGDDSVKWHAFSRLQMVTTPDSGTAFTIKDRQCLGLFKQNKNYNADTDSYYYEAELMHVLGPGQSFLTNTLTLLSGGVKQNVEVLKEDDTTDSISIEVFNQRALVNNLDQQTLWEIYYSDEYTTDPTLAIGVKALSDKSIETKIQVTNAGDGEGQVTLTIPLSALYSAGDTFSIIPAIIESPETTKFAFNCDSIDGEIEKNDPKNLLPLYHNTLINFKYNDSENKFKITLSNLYNNDIILIYLYPIKRCISYNVDAIDDILNVEYKVEYIESEVEKELSLSEINAWESGNGYAKYDVVSYNQKYYICISAISEGNNTSKRSPNLETNYWVSQSTIYSKGSKSPTEETPVLVYETSSEDIDETLLQAVVDNSMLLSDPTDKASTKVCKFDFSYEPDELEEILNPLDPLSFYKENHICNKMTISQIESINIKLARQSRL